MNLRFDAAFYGGKTVKKLLTLAALACAVLLAACPNDSGENGENTGTKETVLIIANNSSRNFDSFESGETAAFFFLDSTVVTDIAANTICTLLEMVSR